MGFKSNKPAALAGMKAAAARGLEICGGVAETYAKQLCPVDTGRLRGSISHMQFGADKEYIGTNVEYAAYVELGTRRQRAKPYLRPAVEGHAAEYRMILESELRKG